MGGEKKTIALIFEGGVQDGGGFQEQFSKILTLPINENLTQIQIKYICKCINSFFENKSDTSKRFAISSFLKTKLEEYKVTGRSVATRE